MYISIYIYIYRERERESRSNINVYIVVGVVARLDLSVALETEDINVCGIHKEICMFQVNI